MNEKEQANLLRWDGDQAGFYEVYFLKWNDAESGTAGWLRYTLTSPCAGPAWCELWGIFFDRRAERGHFALKERYPIERLRWDSNRFQLDLGDAVLTQNACRGELRDRRRDNQLAWDLRFDSPDPPLFHFPSRKLYSLPLPKTKFLAPHAHARFSGTLVADGRRIEIDGAPGQQAHLWGSQHALEHVWGHCNTFAEDAEACFEGLHARVALGPFRSPALKIFFLRHGGRWHKFNSPRLMLKNRSDWSLGRWRFAADNGELSIQGVVEGELRDFLGVTYRDPDGAPLWCSNSKVASLRLDVADAAGRPLAHLSSEGGCAVEFVERRVRPEVPIWI